MAKRLAKKATPATDAERAAAYRARRRGGPARTLQPHGTIAAARRHQRAGEQLCRKCAPVWREHQAAMYAQRKGTR